ncbi:MAG: tRNA glutamyl-Q(34) synthetase GluQRS, partial [Proteobacteria bacterium]|nr:tRNA glutamyl-Q(34) synthetase GluQRS [Pseudomonadota bacterium]
GPLHMGSLVAALASYLDARQAGGRWFLRIEDLDPPRESPSAPEEIKSQLMAHGLRWDSELFQSSRLPAYDEALLRLASLQRLFCCTCTRRSLPAVYPGTCRGISETSRPHALRFQIPDHPLSVQDRLFGNLSWDMPSQVGDFIVRRKDGLIAYQLAVVVDDDFQQITDVVRGADLLDSTPRQLALCEALGFRRPRYLHIPVIVDGQGNKLSKQAHAPAISNHRAVQNLQQALAILGQPDQASQKTVGGIIDAAVRHWNPGRIPARNTLSLN